MSVKVLFILFAVFASQSFIVNVETSKILCIYPTPSQSHFIIAEALLKELVNRGHEVTAISPFPDPVPLNGYRKIDIPFNKEHNEIMKNLLEHSGNMLLMLQDLMQFSLLSLDNARIVMEMDEFKKIRDEESFDLIILESLVTESILGLGAHFGTPIITISSMPPAKSMHDIVGNFIHPSIDKSQMNSHMDVLNFWDRFSNFMCLGAEILFYKYFDHHNTKLYDQYFPSPKYPTMAEMKKNISLVMVNNHFSQGNVRPNVPAFIEIGGIQAKLKPSILPPELEKIMNHPKGVIYFSMGSNIKGTDLPEDILNSFNNVFKRTQQQIIWKLENSSMLHFMPQNVYTAKWLPQDDILAHPNTKLFITHGGLGSMIEARYHGVPIVGIPIFGDQMTNIDSAVSEGWAYRLDYENVEPITFRDAIRTVLGDIKYTENIKRLSALYRDRPQSALDTAVFWTEYVIRHKGAKHIQCNSIHLNFFQLYSLDVIGFIVVILGCFVFFILTVIRFICCRRKRVSDTNNKNKIT